jgi:hypothetical protein
LGGGRKVIQKNPIAPRLGCGIEQNLESAAGLVSEPPIEGALAAAVLPDLVSHQSISRYV